MGGREALERFAKTFYDMLYEDPWLGEFFKDIDQAFIESQQVDFLQGALGGVKQFSGRPPKSAHMHMFITEELFLLRRDYVILALEKENINLDMREKILRIDDSFKLAIVKKLDECEKRYFTDTIMNFPKPSNYKKVA